MTKKVYVMLAVIVLVLTVIFIRQKNELKTSGEGRANKVEVKGKLVEGFPQFPVLTGAKIEESYKKESQGKFGYEVELITSNTPKQVLMWYWDELEKEGWAVYDENIEESEEGDYFLMAQKGNLKVGVFAENEDSETDVTIEFPLQ